MYALMHNLWVCCWLTVKWQIITASLHIFSLQLSFDNFKSHELLLTHLLTAVQKTHKAGESTAASTHVKEKAMFGLYVLINKIKQNVPTLPVTMWWWRWHWCLAWGRVSGLLWRCICCNILWDYITAVYCCMWRDRCTGEWDICTSREFIREPWDVKQITWSNYSLSLWHNESSKFSNAVGTEWTHTFILFMYLEYHTSA